MKTYLKNSKFEIRHLVSYVVAIASVFIASIGCSGGLQKNDAAKLITESTQSNKEFEPGYFYLWVGRHEKNCIPPGDYVDDAAFDFEAKLPIWEKLESVGYIKIEKSRDKISCGRGEGEIIDISLTDKGKSIFIHEKDNYYKTEIYKKVFVEVKDIFEAASKPPTFQVNYVWKYEGIGIVDIVKAIVLNLSAHKLNEHKESRVWIAKLEGGKWTVIWGQPLGVRVFN